MGAVLPPFTGHGGMGAIHAGNDIYVGDGRDNIRMLAKYNLFRSISCAMTTK
jgi:hypothetical protein